jgi:hypothetical protein
MGRKQKLQDLNLELIDFLTALRDQIDSTLGELGVDESVSPDLDDEED